MTAFLDPRAIFNCSARSRAEVKFNHSLIEHELIAKRRFPLPLEIAVKYGILLWQEKRSIPAQLRSVSGIRSSRIPDSG